MTILKADEVARLLRLAPSTIYEMARRGDLPSVRIGNRVVRFVAEDIERLIKECVGSNER